MFFPFLLAVVFLLDAVAPALAQTPSPAFTEAVQLADAGSDVDALAAFRQLASRNPNDHQARLWIARLHERMGHAELAEPVYRSVLLEDPENFEAMVGVASTLLERDEPEDALELLAAAEARAPKNGTVLALLGDAHWYAGRTTLALLYYERAAMVAPTEEHLLRLENARLAYMHRLDTRLFAEDFDLPGTDATWSGDITLNYRLQDTLRLIARGQVQRKLGFSDQRGGGGLEWRWKPRTTLRGHALVGPDNDVMPEGDYLGEAEYTRGAATWSAGFRYFDFTGAWTSVFSPAVTWLPADNMAFGLRYAASWTEASTFASRQTGHSAQLRGAYRVRRRVWLHAGYAAGVEDFENFSIDRIGDFRADTASGGVRLDLPSLFTVIGTYEHQWRSGNVDMGRVTVSLHQRF